MRDDEATGNPLGDSVGARRPASEARRCEPRAERRDSELYVPAVIVGSVDTQPQAVDESVERLYLASVEHPDIAAAVDEGHVGDFDIDVRSRDLEDPCDTVRPLTLCRRFAF